MYQANLNIADIKCIMHFMTEGQVVYKVFSKKTSNHESKFLMAQKLFQKNLLASPIDFSFLFKAFLCTN